MNKLVILACSKTKIWDNNDSLTNDDKVKAKDAYQGYTFRQGKKYAEKNKYPYLILSAKYGIINPDKSIGDYNKKLSSKKEARKIKKKSKEKLNKIAEEYDEIFLIGGNKYYRKIFEDLNKEKFNYLKAKNQGDLRKKVKELVKG